MEEVVSLQLPKAYQSLGPEVGLQIQRSVFIRESEPGMHPGRKRLSPEHRAACDSGNVAVLVILLPETFHETEFANMSPGSSQNRGDWMGMGLVRITICID